MHQMSTACGCLCICTVNSVIYFDRSVDVRKYVKEFLCCIIVCTVIHQMQQSSGDMYHAHRMTTANDRVTQMILVHDST